VVVAIAGLNDVPESSSLQVYLHHQGQLGVVRPHQRGVDDAGGGRLLNDALAAAAWAARWR
jgi:hypothetical protein